MAESLTGFCCTDRYYGATGKIFLSHSTKNKMDLLTAGMPTQCHFSLKQIVPTLSERLKSAQGAIRHFCWTDPEIFVWLRGICELWGLIHTPLA